MGGGGERRGSCDGRGRGGEGVMGGGGERRGRCDGRGRGEEGKV